MTVFDRVEKIREEQKLGVVEFIDITGISKTSYYSLSKGTSKKITAKTANKIINAFPKTQYTYEWLTEDSEKVLKNTSEYLSEVEIKKLQELALEVDKNWSKLISHSRLFNARFEAEAGKWALRVKRGEI